MNRRLTRNSRYGYLGDPTLLMRVRLKDDMSGGSAVAYKLIFREGVWRASAIEVTIYDPWETGGYDYLVAEDECLVRYVRTAGRWEILDAPCPSE